MCKIEIRRLGNTINLLSVIQKWNNVEIETTICAFIGYTNKIRKMSTRFTFNIQHLNHHSHSNYKYIDTIREMQKERKKIIAQHTQSNAEIVCGFAAHMRCIIQIAIYKGIHIIVPISNIKRLTLTSVKKVFKIVESNFSSLLN